MAEPWTETEIAAFLDDELTGAERARIARILETDPEALACAERLHETDALLREAFAAPLSEPTPAGLAAILSEDREVATLEARRRQQVGRAPSRSASRANRASRWAPAALAASVALVIGAAGGALFADRDAPGDATMAALSVGPAPAAVAAALDAASSGATLNGVHPVASFPLAGGGMCREFELEAQAKAPAAFGVACKAGDAWRVLFAAAFETDAFETGDAQAGDAFGTASGVAIDAAGPILDALGAGAALTPDEEEAAIARGWR